MKPGRELDALVAEKVIGVDDVNFRCPQCGGHHFGSDFTKLIDLHVCHRPPYGCGWSGAIMEAVPEYSTDIAAVWEVVEKLRGKGLRLRLVEYMDGFYAVFAAMAIDTVPWQAEQVETAPTAMCLAALKVTEVATVADPK